MKQITLSLLLALGFQSTALAYHPCHPPQPSAVPLSLTCSPRLDVDDDEYAKIHVGFLLSNVACDNKTGVANNLSFGLIDLVGLGFQTQEAISERDISHVHPAAGGNPKVRLIQTATFSTGGAEDLVKFTSGARADLSETSRVSVEFRIDKTAPYSNPARGEHDVSYPAVATFTRTFEDGSVLNKTETTYGCSLNNEGVQLADYDRQNGWSVKE